MDPSLERRLGRSELRVTQLGFGAAPLGNLYEALDDASAQAAVSRALAGGVRFFDTAPLYGYGLSERRLGDALRAQPRDEVVISSKVGRLLRPFDPRADDGERPFVGALPFHPVYDYSYDGVIRSFEDSLQRLGTHRIDVVLLHDLGRVTHGEAAHPGLFRIAMEGGCVALAELRRAGVIGAIGLGVNEWPVCLEAMAHADLDCLLLAGRYTLLEQTALERLLPACAKRGISLIVGGPYNSGLLASKPSARARYDYHAPPPEVLARAEHLDRVCESHGVPLQAAALQLPLFHPSVATVIPGARSAEEVEQNLAWLGHTIPASLWRDLRSEGLLREDAPAGDA